MVPLSPQALLDVNPGVCKARNLRLKLHVRHRVARNCSSLAAESTRLSLTCLELIRGVLILGHQEDRFDARIQACGYEAEFEFDSKSETARNPRTRKYLARLLRRNSQAGHRTLLHNTFFSPLTAPRPPIRRCADRGFFLLFTATATITPIKHLGSSAHDSWTVCDGSELAPGRLQSST